MQNQEVESIMFHFQEVSLVTVMCYVQAQYFFYFIIIIIIIFKISWLGWEKHHVFVSNTVKYLKYPVESCKQMLEQHGPLSNISKGCNVKFI